MSLSKTQTDYLVSKYLLTCAYCGEGFIEEFLGQSRAWQVDHIVPKSKGGDNSLDNLCMACRTCNLWKSNHSLAEFKAVLEAKKVKYSSYLIKVNSALERLNGQE